MTVEQLKKAKELQNQIIEIQENITSCMECVDRNGPALFCVTTATSREFRFEKVPEVVRLEMLSVLERHYTGELTKLNKEFEEL